MHDRLYQRWGGYTTVSYNAVPLNLSKKKGSILDLNFEILVTVLAEIVSHSAQHRTGHLVVLQESNTDKSKDGILQLFLWAAPQ